MKEETRTSLKYWISIIIVTALFIVFFELGRNYERASEDNAEYRRGYEVGHSNGRGLGCDIGYDIGYEACKEQIKNVNELSYYFDNQ